MLRSELLTGLQSWPYSCGCKEGCGSQEWVGIFFKSCCQQLSAVLFFIFITSLPENQSCLFPFCKDGKSHKESATQRSPGSLCDVGSPSGPPAVRKVKSLRTRPEKEFLHCKCLPVHHFLLLPQNRTLFRSTLFSFKEKLHLNKSISTTCRALVHARGSYFWNRMAELGSILMKSFTWDALTFNRSH